jgi:hypothetical protein
VIDRFADELDAVTGKVYDDFTEENGTDYEFQLKS